MMRRRIALWLLAATALAAACAPADATEVRAVFVDVADLTTRASVRVADVPVGMVTGIRLTEDYQAEVTMRLRGDIELPQRVSARLRKTNVLGERFVELVPDRSSGGRLEDGAVITNTRMVPDLEDVVGAGSELLAAVTADRIAAAIEAGAVGLGDRGETLSTLIVDLSTIVDRYDANSQDLIRLIDGLDTFLSEVGPNADLHGQAFDELARTAAVLQEEDERLLDALSDAAALSRTGLDLMVTHRRRIDDFFIRFERISDELVEHDEHVARFGYEWHKHNYNTIRGVNAEHAQVLLDFIVCGMNDEPGDPVRACETPPQGVPRPEPAPER